MTDPQGAPKLIIDTDWKAQAQAEKERLAAAERAKSPPKPSPTSPQSPAHGPAAPGAEPDDFPDSDAPPKADLIELIRMLASQALLYLGAVPDPETGRRLVSLELAQFNVDLLSTLEAKTKGNLTEQESKFLTRVLYELRMQYVEVAKAVSKAVAEGKIAPQGQTSPGGIITPPSAAPGVPPITFKPAP